MKYTVLPAEVAATVVAVVFAPNSPPDVPLPPNIDPLPPNVNPVDPLVEAVKENPLDAVVFAPAAFMLGRALVEADLIMDVGCFGVKENPVVGVVTGVAGLVCDAEVDDTGAT